MTQPKGWPASLTYVTGRQVRRYRTALGMSAEAVAKAVTALGLPYTRTQVAGLENGRRETVTVGEVLVFAAVLGVPPMFLIAPVGSTEPVEVLPGERVDAWNAFLWMTGDVGEPFAGAEIPKSSHETAALFNTYRRYQRSLSLFALTPADERKGYLEALLNVRAEIVDRGWQLPNLPSDVKHEVEAAEKLRIESGTK